MNARIGPVVDPEAASPTQPHWCTATVAPNAAAIDSRKPPVAMSGTTTDRNTRTRMTSDRPTTTSR